MIWQGNGANSLEMVPTGISEVRGGYSTGLSLVIAAFFVLLHIVRTFMTL